LTIGFNELRRAPVTPDWKFYVDGLRAGVWTLLLKCNGSVVEVEPEQFAIAERGHAVIEFRRAPAAPQ
ncbi:MAG: hypothetical protein ABI837_13545, partial [Acidobacteriota bacterium]